MNKAGAALAAAALMTAGAGTTAAQAAAPCPTGWGSQAESGSAMSSGALTNVRAGRHACFDRLVLDVSRSTRGAYDVRYVPAVATEGSGEQVPLRGAADLQVVVRAPAYSTTTGAPTYRPRDDDELVSTRGYTAFRQVAFAGSFEGQSTVGVGVRAKLPFRVSVVDRPNGASSLVVDVAHRW